MNIYIYIIFNIYIYIDRCIYTVYIIYVCIYIIYNIIYMYIIYIHIYIHIYIIYIYNTGISMAKVQNLLCAIFPYNSFPLPLLTIQEQHKGLNLLSIIIYLILASPWLRTYF